MEQPLPPPPVSMFAKAVQEQFFKHLALQSSSVILLLIQECVVSGIFIPAIRRKPSLFFCQKVNADAKHKHLKKVVLVVAITVSLVLLMLLAFSYIYMTKTKYKGKFLSLKAFL